MFRRFIVTLLITTLTVSLARVAKAELTIERVPLLPSVVTPLPPSLLTAFTGPGAYARVTEAGLTPLDHTLLGQVARLLDSLRPPAAGRPREAAWRNSALRDPARDRDATSFGILSARMSTSGMAFVGAGAGSAAAQLVNLFDVANKIPVKILPTMCQGGGGVGFKLRW